MVTWPWTKKTGALWSAWVSLRWSQAPGSTPGKGFGSESLEYSEAVIAVHKGSS